MKRAEAGMLLSQRHHEGPDMHFSSFQPPFKLFIGLIFILNTSLVSAALSFPLDLHTKGIFCSLELEDGAVASTSCHLRNVTAAHACRTYECVCERWQHPPACENSSPGPSVFLLKPICEFTRLIHCDLSADLLLSPSHSPPASVGLLKYSRHLCLAKQFSPIRSAFISVNVAWTCWY